MRADAHLRLLVVSFASMLTVGGCVSGWRYEAMPISDYSKQNSGAKEAIGVCTQDDELIVFDTPSVTPDQICGTVSLMEYKQRSASGPPVSDVARRCLAVEDVARVLVRRSTTVSAFAPFVGPSCGPGANAPLTAYEDGTVRLENGLIVMNSSATKSGQALPADFPPVELVE